jgi:hypothetical protein
MVPSVIGLIGSGRLTITGPDRGNQAGVIGASNLRKARMIVGCSSSQLAQGHEREFRG